MDRFLPSKSREIPAVKQLKRYNTKEEVIEVLCKEVGKGFDEMKKERGIARQIGMDLLYRFGGLTGTEIGEMMGVNYSTVSQGRKRLRETLKRDKGLLKIIERIEANLSRRNRLSENCFADQKLYYILNANYNLINM